MKPVRALVIALLGYAAVLVPSVSQARSVELSLPGISVRLPAPPIPILLPPGVSIREERGYDSGYEYRRMPPPPRYYREGWRHERWEDRRDDHHYRHDRHDHDDHGGRWGHDRDGWRR